MYYVLQEKGPIVLLPLNAQKEKHFEEKFAQESNATFWYKDEKTIVSSHNNSKVKVVCKCDTLYLPRHELVLHLTNTG